MGLVGFVGVKVVCVAVASILLPAPHASLHFNLKLLPTVLVAVVRLLDLRFCSRFLCRLFPDESRHVNGRYPHQIELFFSLHGGDIARSK